MSLTLQPGPTAQPTIPPASNPARLLGYFWRENRTMAVFFYATVLTLVLSVGGMLLDPRTVLGQSTWAKSVKFMLSFLFYIPTMYWLFSHVNIRPRLKAFVMHGSAAILLLELVLLVVQAVRGVPMHYNVSTPFNAALWGVMSVTIMVFYVLSFVGGALLVMQQMRERVYGDALRWGMALMLLGFGLGFLMTNPTDAQLADLQAGAAPTFIGAHTVGAPDGGVGLPLLGWSTEHGDLRIAHFVGIHGAQFMLVVGWAVTAFGGALNLNRARRLLLVWASGLTYAVLTLLFAWQGLRGESLVQPSTPTLAAFAATLAVAGLVHGGVIALPRRAQGA